MVHQVINNGSVPGDGTGDTLYAAFAKVNANETELYGAKVTRNGSSIVLAKTAGTGIQVDEVLPTYGWHDLIGDISPLTTGVGALTRAVYRAPINQLYATAGDIIDLQYHLPHDYAPNTDIFIHVHWSHTGTAISGSMLFTPSLIYAKGHNQASFPATVVSPIISVPVLSIVTHPQYQHFISEVQASISGGSATQLNTTLIEPDGLIIGALVATTIPTVTGGFLFIHAVDIHYQSTCVATKQKSPNFYA
jgi:hypothetical protein